jgi:arginase
MSARGADVQVVAVPYDSAHRDRRMGAGPTHLIERGLPDRLRAIGRQVAVRQLAPSEGSWVAEIGTAFDLDRQLAGAVSAAVSGGAFPLTLSGNCISSAGTVAGLGAGRTGVLWFDAHGDFNTPETTTGGFLDGMALSVLTGSCWTALAASIPGFAPVPEDRVVLVGAGDLDPAEGERLAASAVTHLSAAEAPSRLGEALEALAARVDRLYVHVDLDVLDAREGRANGYATQPGLTRSALLEAIAAAKRHCRLAAGAITSYDPSCDTDGRICATAFEVAETLVAANHG